MTELDNLKHGVFLVKPVCFLYSNFWKEGLLVLVSPLGYRNIITASPFAKIQQEREKQRKEHLERLKEITVQSDPLPVNKLNYKKAVVALTTVGLGGVGFWYSTKALYNLLPSFQREVIEKQPFPTSHWAKLFYNIPGTQAIPWLYALRHSLTGLVVGGTTGYQAYQENRRGRLDLNAVYRELHREGIQGKGFKIAVLDYFPSLEKSGKAKQVNSKHWQAMNLVTASHGAAVSEVIHRAVPQAEILQFSVLGTQIHDEIWEKMRNLIESSKKKPETITRQAVRECLKPFVEHLSDNLKASVDQGVSVVNVSIGPENLIPTLIRLAMLESHHNFRKQALKTVLFGEPDFDSFEEEKNFYKQLQQLLNPFGSLQDQNSPIQQELLQTYQPWYDALNYAASKNVLVIVSAGNKGRMILKAKPDGLNHINPLGLKQGSSKVMCAASTNEQGELSDFSSEYNNTITPDIAANGSGQLNTKGRVFLPSVSWLEVNPLLSFALAEDYCNPHGTSFAAPDITGLYVMMQSARKKDGKSLLTVDEFQQILRLAAKPVEFTRQKQALANIEAKELTQLDEKKLKQQAETIDKEVVNMDTADEHAFKKRKQEERQENLNKFREQLKKQLEQEAVKRRVGPYGTIAGRRLHAVALGRAYESEVQMQQQIDSLSEVD